MATRDEPLKDVVRALLTSVWPISFIWVPATSSQSALLTVRHELSSEWIFKSKDVLESQDTDLEMSQGSNVSKTRPS